MLCCSGLDLMAIAPDAFAITHDLVPNGAAALFLTSEDGERYARFHEDCPDDVQEVCLRDELFEGPDEMNVQRLVGRKGAPKYGQLFEPPPSYFMSNTYQLLIRGCGYHHTLDARLEVDGRKLGVVALFRENGLRFDAEDLAGLQRITHYLEHAARNSAGNHWEDDGVPGRQAIIIASARADVLYISPAASVLLDEIPLVGTEWPDRRRLPLACQRLIEILKNNGEHSWQMPSCTLTLAGGVVDIRAQWMVAAPALTQDDPDAIADKGVVGITLTRRTPLALRVWRNVSAALLSPRQMEVAFWMAMGGGREAARERLSISESVLRDCVKALYEKFDCSSQSDLVAVLRRA